MFWRFGGYANISTLDTLLDKPDVTLEELLDESDLIQELKQHNSKLIEFIRDESRLRRLLEYVIAPKPYNLDEDEEVSDVPNYGVDGGHTRRQSKGKFKLYNLSEEEREEEEKKRLKYAYISCEVLSSETWSISESLMENQHHLRHFWEFLKREPPLDALQAGYFTKVNETLLDKKTEEMLEFFKTLENAVPNMLQHVDCPMVMDLLLKIISLEKAEGGQGIVDWLHSQNLIPILLSYLSPEHSSATQTSAGDFLKAIITISANASQNEQSCIGPNDLTRQLVSEPCISTLTTEMLHGGNPLTVGVGIIIEVIRKNNSDYDPDIGAADSPPSGRDPIYLGTLLRLFAQHVPDFMGLILSPNHTVINGDGTTAVKRRELKAAFGEKIEPLGFDRFKTCELMAELLHCSNMGLLNERGSERYVKERDRERERLKQEGGFSAIREVHSNSTDFTEDSTGYQNGMSPPYRFGSGSPEEIRRPDLQNVDEEEGFEDVGVSGALVEEVRDDFDERQDPEINSKASGMSKPVKTIHVPVIDEDEFVDEPLSSPRVVPKPAHDAVEQEVALQLPHTSGEEPLSPTSAGLTAQVGGLDLDNDTIMTSPSVSCPDEDRREGLIESAVPLPPGIINSDSSNTGTTSPPNTEGNHHGIVDQNSLILTPDSSTPRDLSPHSEDHPEPLFASRLDQSQLAATLDADPQRQVGAGDSQETIDTTLGEEGDSIRSVLMSGNDTDNSFGPFVETDIDGKPVVGDFLKMMFVEHRVVPTILDFFFRFPWNNFLHNVVYDVVQQVFNGPMDRGYNRTLAVDLFETGRITERIVEGQRQSDTAQEKSNMRLGYMGHLTLIAEEVVKFTERHPPELLSQVVLDKVMDREWIDYVEQTLAETRERDNAILGGVRPDVSLGPRQAVMSAVNAAQAFGNGASASLASAGLAGVGGVGLDPIDIVNGNSVMGSSFNLGGGLVSGFGNSSDEEDEEMEEDHDEEGGRIGAPSGSDQFSRYVPQEIGSVDRFGSLEEDEDPGFSAIPPNAPPPPPPLNLPPPRARRRFEARLARHKQNQERETHSGQEELLTSQPGVSVEFTQIEEGRFTIESDDGDADDFGPDADVQPSLLSSFQRFFRSSGKPSSLPNPSHNHPLFTPGSWSSLSSQTQSLPSSAATTTAPTGAQPTTEEDADLGLTKCQQSSSSDDETDAFDGKTLSPRRPSTTEAVRREVLEAEDDEDGYDGDVVDFGREKADEAEEEEEREDLVEIKPPRKGLLLETSSLPSLHFALGAAEKTAGEPAAANESTTSSSAVGEGDAWSGHDENSSIPIEQAIPLPLSPPIRETSSF
ncbi:hypothetical protein FGG08_001336 [Glutinoglossum americanum]|uniref:Extragenic suppressor of kinetochore protein 1 n=1 Tax=Glutinoglossum americanum TaxID=1670608 RepID=A0A9P8I756_9PEZI|nr:hypothetical protein FGG08_001336 [Glutinoglossum americanum]